MSTADLEAILRERPDDRTTLAVYADALQAEGDPRGELIAVELERANGDRPELAARCRELQAAWLGVDLEAVIHDGIVARYGFVEHLVLGGDESRTEVATLATILSNAAPWIRRATVACQPAALAGAVDLLTAQALPSLVRLDLAVRGYSGARGHLLTRQMTRDLIATTPRLVELGLDGARICERLVHPTVRALRIDGDSISELSAPSVTHLDLRADEPFEAELPALVHLALDRNEPDFSAPPDRYRIATAWPRLCHLVLPSVRTPDDRRHAQAVLDQLPELETLAIRRDHRVFGRQVAELRHPRARIALPPAWPWPPRATIRFEFRVESEREFLPLDDLIPALEAQYDHLPDRARGQWDELWQHLSWTDHDHLEVSTALLVSALDALELSSTGPFSAYRQELRTDARAMTVIHPAF